MVRYPITDYVAPSRAVYTAVAEARGCDSLDLPPLAWTIDPDVLDAFVEQLADTTTFTSTFEYAGCSVTITDREVRVTVR